MRWLDRLLKKKPEHPLRVAGAGHLYPAQPAALCALIQAQLDAQSLAPAPMPRALITPFGDLSVVGPIMAPAYATLRAHASTIQRVLILAPALRIPFHGLALPSHDAFACPTGHLWLDAYTLRELVDDDTVRTLDAPHDVELAIALQLPYLVALLPHAQLLPLLVGDGGLDGARAALEVLWDDTTLAIIATELVSELPPAEAAALDAQTAQAIASLDPDPIGPDHASGRWPLRALLELCALRGYSTQPLAHADSNTLRHAQDPLVNTFGAWAIHAPTP